MKPYIKNILGIMAAAIFCLTSSSCSDDKENDVDVLQGDYSAMVEISYTATGDDSELNPVLVTIFENGDQSSQEEVVLNKEWSKTVTYSTLPATVGFIAEPSLHDDVASGAEVSASFKGTCTVTLLCGDEIVDFQTIEIDETATYEQSDDLSIVTDYVFSVSEEGITRIYDENYINDDDLLEAEETPEEDQDAVKVTGNLYYISSVIEDEIEASLHDNLVARFASRSIWSGSELTYGDYLLLKGSEIASANETALQKSLDNGCIVILEEVDNIETLLSFCEKYDIYCPITEAPADMVYCLFILAEADVDLDSDPDNGIRGLFFMISPTDGEDGYMSDYSQGLVVDNAVSVLNDLFVSSSSNAVSTRAVDQEELTRIVSAYKVFLSLNQTLKRSDYRSGDKSNATDSQTNVYSVEYDIYNCFDTENKLNYYYIHQEILCDFKPCYKSVYSTKVKTNNCNTVAKVCEWYADELTLTTVPKGTDGLIILRNSPETTLSSTTYSSGFSWDLSGTVGYESGEPTITGSGGVSFSKETSYTKEDVEVRNNCSPGTKLAWTFDFARAWTNYKLTCTACTHMHEGASAGRNSYTGGTDFIISFPEADAAPVLTGTISVTLRSSAGKCGTICGERTKTATGEMDITLPALSSTDFDGLESESSGTESGGTESGGTE